MNVKGRHSRAVGVVWALAVLGVPGASVAACAGAIPAPQMAPLPVTPPPPGVVRYMVGGDARNDRERVIPWAFRQAKARGARAFLFLGDIELSPEIDERIQEDLAMLAPIPFYPVLGNHEVLHFGVVRVTGIGAVDWEKKFRRRFLHTKQTPVASAFEDKIVYSIDLDGGVHFVALDNVSQVGFGTEQLAWLAKDLRDARKRDSVKFVVVGMHKALAKNGVTTHSMDEDGEVAVEDSDVALALFRKHAVSMIFASHVHEYATFVHAGIPSFITGGLGAPIVRKPTVSEAQGYHHVLQLDVSDKLDVTVVPFMGETHLVDSDEDEHEGEDEDENVHEKQ